MTAYWTTLSHNGVYFPPAYQPEGLEVKVKGRPVALSPLAEEMGYHLAKKKDTPYFADPVFVANFMRDFSGQLPDWCDGAAFADVDFSLLFDRADREKREKELMSKERKKSLAAERKSLRESLKEKYGFAMLDGKRVEFANYMVEPPGLFMGRGQHPMRGHWKPRVVPSDVILNLGEGATVPPGPWKEVVHDHDSMWMAKWVDKLTEKEKYVWLHEGSPLQQSRNKEKYDKAARAGTHLAKIRAKILKALSSRDERLKQVATVCYLIDMLGMRVGDEKDEDEADTVGASTLRVEHIAFEGSAVEFSFLGKDSVPWHKRLEDPPPALLRDLREFAEGKKPEEQVFSEISSGMVNHFLSGIVSGLSAKVFRTYHATVVARDFLASKDPSDMDDIDKVYHAKLANLASATFCNHQRTPPKNWDQSLAKKQERLKELQEKGKADGKRLKKLVMDIDLQKKTKTYNLNTSLKNYIDPRVYKSWCDYSKLDWTKIYSKSMQKKFSWVEGSRVKWEPKPEEVAPVPQSG